MSTLYFSHELREFRQAAGLSRKDMAQILGVSDYTVRSWENGKANPQSTTLWGILDRLASSERLRVARLVDLDRLRAIVEDYARSLDLSPVENRQSKIHRIERTLSKSVLKASQTDFYFDSDRKQLALMPFYSDLALFEASDKVAIASLLENAVESALELVGKLEDVNIEQRYLSEALSDYAEQCGRDIPNPRILERKGGLVRFVLNSEDISSSVNQFLLKEIEQFVDIHNELMRGLFGEALANSRLIDPEKVSDGIIGDAVGPFDDTARQLAELSRELIADPDTLVSLSPEIEAIVRDVGKEVSELEIAASQANDPNTRALRVARLKVSVFHGALLIGRLLLRTTGATLTYGASLAGIASLVEAVAPGSIRAAYEFLRSVIPDLPPFPII